MCSKEYQESTVKEQSGHRSKAVESYMRPNEKIRKGVSNTLQTKRPSDANKVIPPLRSVNINNFHI